MGRVFHLISDMLHTLIHIEKEEKKHYFAKRVCFMCHNLTFSHCILSSTDVIIVIAATVSVVIATERYVPYIYESCFR